MLVWSGHSCPLPLTLDFDITFELDPKKQAAPEIPRPSREPINPHPVKVTLIVETTPPQIKLLEAGLHPVLRTLHLSLRDNPFRKERMHLEGSPRDLALIANEGETAKR